MFDLITVKEVGGFRGAVLQTVYAFYDFFHSYMIYLKTCYLSG